MKKWRAILIAGVGCLIVAGCATTRQSYTRLVHVFLIVPEAEGSLVGEEQRFGKRVVELAAIELELNRLVERLLVIIPENVNGFGNPVRRHFVVRTQFLRNQ